MITTMAGLTSGAVACPSSMLSAASAAAAFSERTRVASSGVYPSGAWGVRSWLRSRKHRSDPCC
ncbi:MAG: hypothetical protein ACLT98_05530 [Eggerthellaceae bacterium]